MNSWAPTELTILELLWCQRISDLTYSGLNSGGLLELEANPYFHLIINNLRWNKYVEMTQDKIYARKTALLKPTES
jgi:hypothetical protein